MASAARQVSVKDPEEMTFNPLAHNLAIDLNSIELLVEIKTHTHGTILGLRLCGLFFFPPPYINIIVFSCFSLTEPGHGSLREVL